MPGPRRSTSSRKLRAAKKHDSLAVTRAAPAIDELAETRESQAISLAGVLDAAEWLIANRGFARTSVEEVAQRAGVAIDVLHGQYPGKGALLRALNARFVEQMIATVDASTRTGSWSSMRVRDVVEIAVRSILDIVEERKALIGAFLAHGVTDPVLAAGLRTIGTHMTARLVHVLEGCKDAKPSPADGRSVGFSLLLSVALAHHCILVGEEWAGIGLTREEVTEELTAAITAYLASRSPS